MSGRLLWWIVLVAGLSAIGIAAVPMMTPVAGVATHLPAEVLPQPGPPPSDPTTLDPPLWLGLPALGVEAAITAVGVDSDGGLAVPDDPAVVGWWHDGARPGATAGTVVLDGHVDTAADGPGALFRIAELRPGDLVRLGTATGERGYVVSAVRRYPKAELPAEVFDRAGRPRLVLISCGGAFDRKLRHYADNVVVYATPMRQRG